jgi:shikimate dehydrogenase
MQVYCIIGDERAYRAKSTTIFTNILQRMGIRGAYVPFKVESCNIGQAIQSLRILNIAGANVTVPYKEAVIPHLDVLSEGANIIGSINTIVRNGDELKGYNTNAIGFMDALTDVGFDPEDKSAMVFGTGGVAKAVVFILNWLRTKTIFVSGRNEQEARKMVARFGGEVLLFSELEGRMLPINIIVNATSVSSTDESPEFDALVHTLDLPECELVMDLNYDRPQNFWQNMAAGKGIRFADGLMPLAYQARRTFALWTGMQVAAEDFVAALSM